MTIDIESLPDDPQLLKQMMLEQVQVIEQQTQRISYLEEQFCLAQHKQFGKSAESHPGQGELFNEAEELAVEAQTG